MPSDMQLRRGARLVRLGGLGVIGPTSAMQYKGTEKSIPEIGAELGVDYILEGTVRWEHLGDQPSSVRITPQLARIYAMVGEHEAAIELLELLLSRPSQMPVALLRLDPRWGPIRDHPRFQALLGEYAEP